MTLQAKDLRLKNLLSYAGQTVYVMGIRQSTHYMIPSHNIELGYFTDSVGFERRENDPDLAPIALTSEWLERFDFVQIDESPFEDLKMKYWVYNRICLFFNEGPPDNTYLLGLADQRFGKYSVVTGNWIEHVHTLQNAFHAIHGEELTLKEARDGRDDKQESVNVPEGSGV